MLAVTAMLVWPSSSPTVLKSIPDATHRLAAECAQVMEPAGSDVGPLGQVVERLGHLPAVEVLPDRVCEDEPRIAPGRAGRHPLFELANALATQGADRTGSERHFALRGPGLRPADSQPPARAWVRLWRTSRYG